VDGALICGDDQDVTSRRFGSTAIAVVGGAALLFSLGRIITSPDPEHLPGFLVWIGVAVAPVYVVAVWLIRKRPDHVQARRLLLVASSAAVGTAMEQIVRPNSELIFTPERLLVINLGYEMVAVLTTVAAVLIIATYPDGRVESRWQRRAIVGIWALATVPVLRLFTSPTVPVAVWFLNPRPIVPNPLALNWLEPVNPALTMLSDGYAAGLAGTVILVVRYRRAESVQRVRMRLLAYSLAIGAPLLLVVPVLRLAGAPEDSPTIKLIQALYVPLLLMIPVSIVVGVMRYGLYEIDLLVRRSLVYAVLSSGIAAVYIALAALPGLALADTVPVWVAVVLTILAAVAFQPLRRRVEALADRWVYGSKINRYQLLTTFGAEIGRTLDIDDLLPRLAATVRRGLDASWVRVEAGGRSIIAGEASGAPKLTVAMARGADPVGRIECGPKRDGYEPSDRELLETLAGQAATAIANLRLTDELAARLDELERSRARIVAAADVERRRIERDIHDGVQQQIVALLMKLRLARNQVERGDRPATEAFTELQNDARDLLSDLRELAHGIHPPVLSDGGLVAAVEARTARLPFDVRVAADQDVRDRRFAADIEGAAYYVICEALTNVAKHASAADAEVTVSTAGDELTVRVRDAGRGFTQPGPPGAGLTNLRDRVEALGGRLRVDATLGAGTTVTAELPVNAHV
jgi:signal transduction histidine kinase